MVAKILALQDRIRNEEACRRRWLRGHRPAAVTLLKLFFQGFSATGSIFRIAALLGLAVIAPATSFPYQFLRSGGQIMKHVSMIDRL